MEEDETLERRVSVLMQDSTEYNKEEEEASE